MRRFILAVSFLVNACLISAQEVCETKEGTIEDLNSITKCTINKTEQTNKEGKKVKLLSVKVSSSLRYLKKRIKSKQTATGLSSDIATTGIKQTNTNSDVTESLNFEEENIINKIKAKYSAEQLKKAVKFEELDQIPLFKSCKNKNTSENLSCFNEEMMAHIQEHFRYPTSAILNKTEGNVWIRFVIDEEGNITNLKAIGPQNGEVLKHEALRVVSKLSLFTPAIKDGKKVLAKYGFPINFSLQE